MTTVCLDAYRTKVLGCWLGKAVGGTLGGPVEGKPGPLTLTFYDPVPERMLPNDDLDLQVVWLEEIRRRGLPINRRMMADAWTEHAHFWPDEYGVASDNLTRGIMPPASGAFNNDFGAGMGAAIRSEIWACLAPGDPRLAAAMAREDGCVDHHGEGLHAEVFLAALESAAFIEHDREKLLDTALAMIPAGCRVAQAVSDTRAWWKKLGEWKRVRRNVLDAHGRQNFTDVAQNIAFIVLGWLAGDGDFGKSICTAVNCGCDTDCTGATLGALLGILDPESIGEEWLKPIGRELVLSPSMVGMHHPHTLDDFTDQLAAAAAAVLRYYESPTWISGAVTSPGFPLGSTIRADLIHLAHEVPSRQGLLATEPLVVKITYPEGIAFAPDTPSSCMVAIMNPTETVCSGGLVPRVPAGWSIRLPDSSTGSATMIPFDLAPGESITVALSVTAPDDDVVRAWRERLDLDFVANGLHWTVTAGLLMTTPWARWPIAEVPERAPEPPVNAEPVETAGRFQAIPEQATAFVARFKLPQERKVRFVIQAPREVRAWVDGVEIVQHDGTYLVPAVHRPGNTKGDIDLRRGWHTLTIALGKESTGRTFAESARRDAKSEELFVGLGDGPTWAWIPDVEWGPPASHIQDRART